MREADSTRAAANVTVSPLSLAVALAMLESGARGRTLTEIAGALGTSSLSPIDQDQGWATVMDTLTRESQADGISLESANSLWLQRRLRMQPTFMSNLARYFSTGVWQVDFAQNLAAAESAINRWVATHTSGRITHLFGPGDLDPTTLLVLANAVYFHASWQSPFDPALSAGGPFYPPSAPTAQVIFMQGQVAKAAVTSRYQVVQLPYAGGHYQAVVVMPTNQSLPAFVKDLNAGQLDQIISTADRPAEVRLPRFTTQSYLNLNQTLAAMGMPTAFSNGADFSGMSTTPLQVDSVVQRDYLKVAEKGTEAAAATGIVMGTSAGLLVNPIITFDHPFLFLVRDVSTGVLLFASLIQNPSLPPS
jgi:serpin B